MKIILDDGTSVPISAVDPQFMQQLLDATEALIETHEKWIATEERKVEAIRKKVFTIRREYDALVAVKDAVERHNELTRKFSEESNLLNTQKESEDVYA